MFVLVLAACGNDDALGDEVASDQQDDPVDEEEPDDTEGDASGGGLAGEIEKAIKEIAKEDFRKTEITEFRVNKDLSVDEERYIVLVDLRWDVKNKPKMTNEMLQEYSNHLAAKMAEFGLIYEFVGFR